jgi:hypothetical protein
VSRQVGFRIKHSLNAVAFTLLSQFFLVPFNARFGASGFVIAWMLEYCGMLALYVYLYFIELPDRSLTWTHSGLAVEAVVTIVTMKFISFFLVIWIISNVSVSYYPIEILPTIYRYGYGTPFYNVARATRTIIFRTRNQGVFCQVPSSITRLMIFSGHELRNSHLLDRGILCYYHSRTAVCEQKSDAGGTRKAGRHAQRSGTASPT